MRGDGFRIVNGLALTWPTRRHLFHPTMLIVCPNCTTGYEVKADALGDAGRTVRCAHCRKEWFAAPAPAAKPAKAAAVAPAPPAAAVVAPVPAPAPALAPAAAALASVPAAVPEPLDWDAPAAPAPAAPAADGEASADEDVAALWGVPESPSPPLAPDSDTIEAAPAPVFEDVETLAARRARRSTYRRLDRIDLPFIPTLIAVQLVMICAGLFWRAEIVHWMPQTASFFRAIGFGVNIRGLQFADIHTAKDTHDGVTVLIIEGAIVNTTSATVAVPRLRFALRNTALAELFSWTAPPERGTLGPGETLPFRSRLASPPADGNDILVRFLNRLDFMNGAR
jgi:predicted Zn finger-like uncharacterized protein